MKSLVNNPQPLIAIPFFDALIMNPLLEIFYNQLGQEMVFNIWISFRIFWTIGEIYFIINLNYL